MARTRTHRNLPAGITARKKGFLGRKYTYTDSLAKDRTFTSLQMMTSFYQSRLLDLAKCLQKDSHPADALRMESIHRSMLKGEPWFLQDDGPFVKCSDCPRKINLIKRKARSTADARKLELEKIRSILDLDSEFETESLEVTEVRGSKPDTVQNVFTQSVAERVVERRLQQQRLKQEVAEQRYEIVLEGPAETLEIDQRYIGPHNHSLESDDDMEEIEFKQEQI